MSNSFFDRPYIRSGTATVYYGEEYPDNKQSQSAIFIANGLGSVTAGLYVYDRSSGDWISAGAGAQLTNTGVLSGTYGDSKNVAQFTVDQQGRLQNATNVPIVLTASEIGITPAGTLTSTNVQSAIYAHQNHLDQLLNISTSNYFAYPTNPTPNNGQDGEYGMNIVTGDIFGPKYNGHWPTTPLGNAYENTQDIITYLSQLADVDTTGAVAGDTIQFNGTEWVPTQNTFTATDINSLSDVDTVTVSPAAGNALLFNGTEWTPGVVSSDLSGMQDVDFTVPPVAGQILEFDGTVWKAKPAVKPATANYQRFYAPNDTGPHVGGTVGDFFQPAAFTIPVAARGPAASPDIEYIQVFLNGVLQERNIQYTITLAGQVQFNGGTSPTAPDVYAGDVISIFLLHNE